MFPIIFALTHPGYHAQKVFKDRKCASNDKKHWNVGFSRAIVNIDRPDNDHTHRDDHRDGTRNGATNGAQQQDE